MKPEDYFSPDYETARARFRDAAARTGATLHQIALAGSGPRGESLSIDVAWLGPARPLRVLLHTSGIHGVEAYTGAAAQLALLAAPPHLGAQNALVLVHVLNPYGMAWLRRTNENNVDLNRNFLAAGERYAGAHALYAALDPLLNPASPPAADAFAVRAAVTVMRHGFHRVKQAIGEGQYDFPRGLFFGGDALQPGPRLYLEWLAQHLGHVEYIFALDLHTGLGRHGTDSVIPTTRVNVTEARVLGAALRRILVDASGRSVAYTVRGSMGAALPNTLPNARIDSVLQEIGTYPPLKVLHALREENRWHFYGDGSIVHPAKCRLFEALCPSSTGWRQRAIGHAVELAKSAARWTIDNAKEPRA